MRCPFCKNEDTQVTDSRAADDGDSVRRRRRCNNCFKRFTTYERIELNLPSVVKNDGSRAEYDRTKLRKSLKIALQKRPVSEENVELAINRIEEQLRSLGEREIFSRNIGELVMLELQMLDKVAYIRFASVYRDFEDVAEFREAIEEVNFDSKNKSSKIN